MKARPYNYWFFISKSQRQKPFPESCVCDKCMLFYQTIPTHPLEVGHKFTMTVSAEHITSLCIESIRLNPIEECMYALGKWPVGAWKEDGKWYRKVRNVEDLINNGSLDVTGELVNIVFNKPLLIYKKPVHHVMQFCATVKDDNGKWCYVKGYHPDEIKARFESLYPTCEP